jgi:hypothetical protein
MRRRFCSVISGLRHFADITGVKADNLPSPEQIEEIKKETKPLRIAQIKRPLILSTCPAHRQNDHVSRSVG